MNVHLVDGTYELFRQHFGRMMRDDPRPNAATIGVLRSTLALFDEGATHVAVASDHVIESFRNDLWPGYKSSAGMPPELLSQLGLVEEALEAMGVTVWAMVEHEADDALGAAALVADADESVEQVLILTPDKDLGQCVRGRRVVQFDRRKRELIDHDGVVAKFGVEPSSIPDYLGLVGDSSDGFPGLPGCGGAQRRKCARPLRTPRADPRCGRTVGRRRAAQPDQAGRHVARALRAGAAVSPARHARHRRRRRHRRVVAVVRPDRRVPAARRTAPGARAGRPGGFPRFPSVVRVAG